MNLNFFDIFGRYVCDTYERADYLKLMKYGSQLRIGCVTNYIKEVSEEEARVK